MDKDNPKLIQSIEANDAKAVLSLINKKSVEAASAALEAAELGSVEVMKAIVEKHSVKLNDPQNLYLLGAAHGGHVDMVNYLVKEAGCNPNDNQFGYSPVSAAAYGGHAELLPILRDLGANLRENEHNTMYLLAKNNMLDMMKHVVDTYGFDIHADEEVALRSATKEGNTDVVNYLLEKGADLDNVGSICLSLAVTNSHFKIASKYVELGVNWDFLSDEKESLKQIADNIENQDSEHAQNLITHLVMGQLDG